MPRPVLALALVIGMCGASWGIGRFTAPEPVPVASEPAGAPVDWRAELTTARASADAGSARASALALLDAAEGDAALVRAVRLLAPVAAAEDLPVLESLARSGEVPLIQAAVDALALIPGSEAGRLLDALVTEPGIRPHALVALGVRGGPDALQVLTLALGDPTTQDAALQGLVALGSDEAAEVVIGRFERAADWEAGTWATALGRFPASAERARSFLRATARGGPPARQEIAMSALAEARDPAMHGLLTARAVTGDLGALRALALFDDGRAATTIARIAGSPSPAAMEAVSALSRMTHPHAATTLRTIVAEGPANLAMQAVWGIRDPANPLDLAVLIAATEERPEVVRQAVMSRLFTHGWVAAPEEVLDLARARLSSFDPGASEALPLLLRHGDRADIGLLRGIVLEGPSSQRSSALWTLQQVRSPTAASLILALCDDPDPSVASQAIQVAAAYGGLERALEPALLRKLEAGGEMYMLAPAAVQLGTPGALLAVERLLREGTPDQQAAAASALLNATDPSVQRRTLDAAGDLPAAARDNVYASALYASTVNPIELADRVLDDPDTQVRHVAVEALANAGTPAAADRLIELSFEPELRDTALYALARVGGPEAEARIAIAVDEPGAGPVVVGALQQLGTPSALRTVTEMSRTADDPGVRVAALYAMQGRPGPDTVDAFMDAVDDEDPSVGSAAVQGLAAIRSPAALAALKQLAESDSAFAVAAASALNPSPTYPLADGEHVPMPEVW